MEFRAAFHSNYALALAGTFAAIGVALTQHHDIEAGMIVVCTGAVMCAAWIGMLPQWPLLLRIWLIVFLSVGAADLLLRLYDGENTYTLSSSTGMLCVHPGTC